MFLPRTTSEDPSVGFPEKREDATAAGVELLGPGAAVLSCGGELLSSDYIAPDASLGRVSQGRKGLVAEGEEVLAGPLA